MIVVDTNVVSEVMRPQPSPAVLGWLNTQNSNLLFITTITLAEIGYGLRVLPDGLRRRLLQTRFEQFIAQAFEDRVLDFTAHAAAMGANAVKVTTIAELEAALTAAKGAKIPQVIVIDTDPWPGTEAGGTWWDVGVSAVSPRAEVNQARANYEEKLKDQWLVD